MIAVPDKNPPCPCSGIWTNRMLRLVEDLLRAHGTRKIRFKWAKCDKENGKFHSIACHYHIIGNYPVTQVARIKRHNYI